MGPVNNNTCIHNSDRINTNPNNYLNNKISTYLNSTANNLTERRKLTDVELDEEPQSIRKTFKQPLIINQNNSEFSQFYF